VNPARVTRAVAFVAACVLLSSCRVDTDVALQVNPNGSGKVSVTVTADAEVVKAAPTLKSDVRADDLVAAGWKMNGPDETEDGGLTVTFSRGFATPAEATVLLSQVNGPRGPLKGLVLDRTGKDSNSTFTLSGTLEINGGLEAFADDAAIKLLDGAPYEDQVRNSGLDLGKIVAIRFAAGMPGKMLTTTGTVDGDIISWRVPTDGTPTDVATATNNVDIASNVARVARWLVGLLAAVWIAGSLVLVAMVAARRGRTRRI
jgi:hypothetical protein